MIDSTYEDKPNWVKKLDIPDMIAAIVSLVLLGVVYLVCPVQAMYVPAGDSQSSYPGDGSSSVEPWLLGVLCLCVPAAIFVGVYYLQKKFSSVFRRFDMAATIWIFITIFAVTNIITQILKTYVGRPRPDIYQRCGAGNQAQMDNCPGLSGMELKDEWLSWPSGHASNAMCVFSFLTLFVQKSIRSYYATISALTSALLFIALWVGASRIVDFRHHTDDVLAGLFIGFLITFFIWNRSSKRIFPKNPESQSELTTPMIMGMP